MSNEKTILLQCGCKGFHFVQIYSDPDWDNSTWITHIERPRGWRQKLRAIWQVVRGEDVFDGELMIDKADYAKLADYFATPTTPKSDNQEIDE